MGTNYFFDIYKFSTASLWFKLIDGWWRIFVKSVAFRLKVNSAVRVFTDTWLFKSIFSYFVCFQRTSYWDLKALTKILRLLAILFIALKVFVWFITFSKFSLSLSSSLLKFPNETFKQWEGDKNLNVKTNSCFSDHNNYKCSLLCYHCTNMKLNFLICGSL